VADTVAMVLKTGGFEPTVAYSGEPGVELAHDREFEYLMTGVVMPQAAIEICELLPECKVLLVSGHNDSYALLQAALSRGYKFGDTRQAGASACTFPNASLIRKPHCPRSSHLMN